MLAMTQVQPSGGSTDVLGNLLQYGVLGILAIILIVFANNAYKREASRADRAEAEVARLNNVIAEKVVPALVTASNSLRDSQFMIRELSEERDREVRRTRSRGQDREAEIGGGRDA